MINTIPLSQVKEFCEEFGYPVMLKAAYGGGGRGMRVVNQAEDLEKMFELATSEALAAFGDGSMFVERCIREFLYLPFSDKKL